MGRIIRPQIRRANRQRPIRRPRHAVGPVEHTHNTVGAARSCTVALFLARRHPAAPDGTGKAAVHEPQVRGGQDEVGLGHVGAALQKRLLFSECNMTAFVL